MGTQEVELERAGEKSAVDSLDLVCSFIHNIINLGPRIFRSVTHDSHKLQTKVINHVTRHYMNRRELESNQSIDAPSLCVLSFPPSVPQCSTVAIAGRRAPHLATTRKDTAAATVLS